MTSFFERESRDCTTAVRAEYGRLDFLSNLSAHRPASNREEGKPRVKRPECNGDVCIFSQRPFLFFSSKGKKQLAFF